MNTPHNPDNIQPEQIPSGYRLITVEEHEYFMSNTRVRPELRMWAVDFFEESHQNWGNGMYHTYITPITNADQPSTPTADPESIPSEEPVWHDPRGIGDPGEGYRFLIRQEVDYRYRHDRSLCFYSPTRLRWIGWPEATGASTEDTYRIADTTPIPGYPNWKPKPPPPEPNLDDLTEDQAKDLLTKLGKPNADLLSAILLQPGNPTVRSFAYQAMMSQPGFSATPEPPQTLVDWLKIIRPAYATKTPQASVVDVAPTPAAAAYEPDDDDVAFTVSAWVDQSGTTSRVVHMTRTVSANIDIPVRIARQGPDAVRAYINDEFRDQSCEGDIDYSDGDLYDDGEDWDSYRLHDLEIDEDLYDECEPYLESDDDDEDEDEL